MSPSLHISRAVAAVALGAALSYFAALAAGVRWPIMVLYWLGQWGLAASAVAAGRPRSGILTRR